MIPPLRQTRNWHCCDGCASFLPSRDGPGTRSLLSSWRLLRWCITSRHPAHTTETPFGRTNIIVIEEKETGDWIIYILGLSPSLPLPSLSGSFFSLLRGQDSWSATGSGPDAPVSLRLHAHLFLSEDVSSWGLFELSLSANRSMGGPVPPYVLNGGGPFRLTDLISPRRRRPYGLALLSLSPSPPHHLFSFIFLLPPSLLHVLFSIRC